MGGGGELWDDRAHPGIHLKIQVATKRPGLIYEDFGRSEIYYIPVVECGLNQAFRRCVGECTPVPDVRRRGGGHTGNCLGDSVLSSSKF